MVANGALSFAQRTGFHEFYFFGVDVGAKDPDYHHSKFSWYNTKGMQMDYALDTTTPGNFGGTVTSAGVFLWSKKSLEQSIMALSGGRHYYNCSDGGLIEGAIPKHPSTVSLPDVAKKRDVVKDLIDKFPFYTEENFERAWSKADLHNTIPEFCEKLSSRLKENDFSDMSYLSEAMTLLRPGNIDDGVAMLFRGSVYQMLMLIHSYGERMTSDEDREAFQKIAREEFSDCLEELRDEVLEIFSSVESDSHVWNT